MILNYENYFVILQTKLQNMSNGLYDTFVIKSEVKN